MLSLSHDHLWQLKISFKLKPKLKKYFKIKWRQGRREQGAGKPDPGLGTMTPNYSISSISLRRTAKTFKQRRMRNK